MLNGALTILAVKVNKGRENVGKSLWQPNDHLRNGKAEIAYEKGRKGNMGRSYADQIDVIKSDHIMDFNTVDLARHCTHYIQ